MKQIPPVAVIEAALETLFDDHTLRAMLREFRGRVPGARVSPHRTVASCPRAG